MVWEQVFESWFNWLIKSRIVSCSSSMSDPKSFFFIIRFYLICLSIFIETVDLIFSITFVINLQNQHAENDPLMFLLLALKWNWPSVAFIRWNPYPYDNEWYVENGDIYYRSSDFGPYLSLKFKIVTTLKKIWEERTDHYCSIWAKNDKNKAPKRRSI